MNNAAERVERADQPRCVCGSDSTHCKFVKDGYKIFRCDSCTLCFVYPQPEPDELIRIYDSDYFRRGNKYKGVGTEARANAQRANDLKKLEILRRHAPSGKILDVGCALGGFIEVALNAGYEATGIEISESSARSARERLGVEIITGTLLNAKLPAASFDIVTMWDVIEHLDRLEDTLAEVHRVLKPGGYFIATTGDISARYPRLAGKFWHLLTPPQHLFYFSPQSIATAFALSKLELVDITHPGKSASLGFVLFKARETFGSAVAPLQKLVQLMRLEDFHLYINLKDIMTCVGRKPLLQERSSVRETG